MAHKWDPTVTWKQESKWRLFNYLRNNKLKVWLQTDKGETNRIQKKLGRRSCVKSVDRKGSKGPGMDLKFLRSFQLEDIICMNLYTAVLTSQPVFYSNCGGLTQEHSPGESLHVPTSSFGRTASVSKSCVF